MHFRELHYFIVLAETLDSSEAAHRNGITRQTLTTAIRRLESEAGGALVVKTPAGLRLTPAGNELHYHAKRLLRLRDDALRAVREADESAAVLPPDGTPPS